jgi:hypothetical protein
MLKRKGGMMIFIKRHTENGITISVINEENGCYGGITIRRNQISQTSGDNVVSQFYFREEREINRRLINMFIDRQRYLGEEVDISVYDEFADFANKNFVKMIMGENIDKELFKFFEKHQVKVSVSKEIELDNKEVNLFYKYND